MTLYQEPPLIKQLLSCDKLDNNILCTSSLPTVYTRITRFIAIQRYEGISHNSLSCVYFISFDGTPI